MDGVVCTFCKNKLINDFFTELTFGDMSIVGANIPGYKHDIFSS